MRSSWEVAVADAFDRAGIDWQYEPRHFTLKKACVYMPDFFLPERDIYVEVIGWLTAKAREKIELFRKQGHKLLVIDGSNIEEITGKKISSLRRKSPSPCSA
jgi:predicted nuclease of restriction endonuclease-like RecB superfamily